MTARASWIQKRVATTAVIAACLFAAQWASAASMAITEWMYSPVGGPGEYFELTNLSGAPINMAGWSQDDNDRIVGKHDLSAFGIVQPGESVIGTEGADASAFKTYWNLPASIKVIAYGSSDNLGRADEINIYDNAAPTPNLIDRLTYDDQTIGGPRTQGTSANIALANVMGNHANLAVASVASDIYHSYKGGGGSGDLGNPGFYPSVPEPASIALALLGALAAIGFKVRGRRL
jgi:lamin tail-like protein/PEP-CTERM motif-containing protein